MAFPITGYKTNWGIEIRGLEGWTSYLRNLEEEVVLKPDLANLIGDEAIRIIKQQVANHEDMEGNKFTGYTEKYAKKKRVSRGAVDLKAVGDMLRSLKFVTYFDRAKTIIIVSLTGTKNKVKGWVHQVGAITGFRKYGRYRMPQRRWFGIQKKNQRKLKDIQISKVEDYLSRVGRQRWLKK